MTVIYAPSSAGCHSPWYIRFHTAQNFNLLEPSPGNQIGSLHALSTKYSCAIRNGQKILAGPVPCSLLYYLLLTFTYLSLGLTSTTPMGGGLISGLYIPTALLSCPYALLPILLSSGSAMPGLWNSWVDLWDHTYAKYSWQGSRLYWSLLWSSSLNIDAVGCHCRAPLGPGSTWCPLICATQFQWTHVSLSLASWLTLWATGLVQSHDFSCS